MAESSTEQITLDGPVYFASDFHLSHPKLEAKYDHIYRSRAGRFFFQKILSSGSRNRRTIVFLGDLFAFWFEKPGFRPRDYDGYLQLLNDYTRQGNTLIVLKGNRDFMLGSEFAQAAGVRLFDGPVKLESSGITVGLDHGDGLVLSTSNSRLMRRLLRNPTVRAVAAGLPAGLMTELGYAYCLFRNYCRYRQRSAMIDFRALPEERFIDCNAFVMGHLHQNRRIDYTGFSCRCPVYIVGGVTETGCLLKLENGQFEFVRVMD